jgi:integrase
MTRTVDDAKIESKSSREKARLKTSPVPYWRALDPGLHIGYRKRKDGGVWVGRQYVGQRPNQAPYKWCTLPGCTDDNAPADGVAVLSYEQAVKLVRQWAAPEQVEPAGPMTVRQACESYVTWLKAHKKTGNDAELRIAKHVLPRLGDKVIADLTDEDLEKCLHAMARPDPDPEVWRRRKDSANRTFTSLKAALNKAFANRNNKIPSDTAWRLVKPYKDVGRARDVFLDEAQCKRLINVTSGAFRNLVTAALLTGARAPHELAGMHVRDFRANLGILTVVAGKTDDRDIVLTNEAVRFFTGLSTGRDPDALLLPKDDGKVWGRADHHRPMKAAVTKAKLPKGTSIYTLRHTHASHAVMNEMSLQLLAKNMGTSVAMIEKHYGKFAKAKERELIEAGALKLGLKQSNVRTLRRSV